MIDLIDFKWQGLNNIVSNYLKFRVLKHPTINGGGDGWRCWLEYEERKKMMMYVRKKTGALQMLDLMSSLVFSPIPPLIGSLNQLNLLFLVDKSLIGIILNS